MIVEKTTQPKIVQEPSTTVVHVLDKTKRRESVYGALPKKNKGAIS